MSAGPGPSAAPWRSAAPHDVPSGVSSAVPAAAADDAVAASRQPMKLTGADAGTSQAGLSQSATVRWVAQTGSTNADLAGALASADTASQWQHLDVLGAELQTAGKGRLGRSWEVPAGAALSISVAVRPTLPVAAYSWITPIAALAVVSTLASVGVRASVKWPNDVLAQSPSGPAKICGILAQLVPMPAPVTGEPEPGLAVVLGVGLNVSQSEQELPVATATSLRLCGASSLDRPTLLQRFCAEFGAGLAAFEAVGGAPEASSAGHPALLPTVSSVMTTLGSAVRAELPGGGMLTGTAERLAADGSLVLRLADGSERAVSAADVVHLRKTADGGEASYA